MPFAAVERARFLSGLNRPALLVTATSGLAMEWKRRLVSRASVEVMATPRVENWRKWLAKMAGENDGIPVPLTALQELQLWERIIRGDMGAQADASARGLARLASGAYALLREYRIDPAELAGTGEEAEALARWIAAVQQALEGNGRMLAADLPEYLLPHASSLIEESIILLDGFERFSPLQQQLLSALQEHGVETMTISPDSDSAPPAITLTACNDAESEYRHLAHRIAAAIKSDPRQRIGVVSSRQVNDHETLRRILDDTLLPQTADLSSLEAISMAGSPLAKAPLISQLLNLLHLAGRSGAPHTELKSLLFSSGLKGHAEEHLARAILDAKLREENRHYLNFEWLLGTEEMEAMPQLGSVLKSLMAWETGRRTAGEWVRALHSLLQSIGFLQADVANRSSDEIRQLNAFRESMASLVAVDAVSGKMEWNAFLSLLSSACNEAILTGPVHFPQVSLLPLEQFAGLKFDTLFAIGFDEEALPLPARPTPLLPLSLQRRHNLPGTTPQLAFSESEFLWQQLRQSAPEVHISFARKKEERELRPSPFLAGIAIEPFDGVAEEEIRLDPEPFDDAPTVPLSDAEEVRGGSAIIRNQSLCPFRAFAYHRLNIAPLGETEPGVTAADKGSLLHRALQHIWEQLGSQRALLELDDAATARLIDDAVEQAWRNARVSLSDAARRFERQRMRSVLTAWLDKERDRPPFSVERCEKPYRLELPESGQIRFAVNLKADRIDRDGEGRKILIDYKSGKKQSATKWIGERPAEPQLPLYAVAEALGPADAVCFARVRSGDMDFEGLSGEATGIRGISVYQGSDEAAGEWTELLEKWRERIDALAVEFVDGRSDVSPQDAHACDYCGLEAVCRIDEIGIDRDESDDEEEVE